MSINGVTNQEFFVLQPERRINRDPLATKVTVLALGILISMSAFVIGSPIEGLVVTTCTFIVLITLFKETLGEERNIIEMAQERQRPRETWSTYFINSLCPAQARHVPVGTGRLTQDHFRGQANFRALSTDRNLGNYEAQQRAAASAALLPEERVPYTARDPRVRVGTGEVTQNDNRAQAECFRALSTDRVQVMSVVPQAVPIQTRTVASPNTPAAPLPADRAPYTARDSRVGVGTQEVTRGNPIPGDRVVVGSGKRG